MSTEEKLSLCADGAQLSSERQRLLIVTPYYAEHGGGVERVALRMAEGLEARGWNVVWMASRHGDGRDAWTGTESRQGYLPVPAWNGVETHTGIPFPVWGLRALRRLWEAVGKADAVVVHESLYVPSMLAALVASIRGKPMVLVQHVSLVPYSSLLVRRLMMLGNLTWSRAIHAMARRTVYVSQAVMRYFKDDLSGGKGALIENGVDLDSFYPEPNRGLAGRERPRILFVGRLVEKKGLDIIEELARQRTDLDFRLAGQGPIRPNNWGLSNVRLLGHLSVEELVHEYRSADLLLLPSHGEGFPLVVQEAMATGLAPLVSEETAAALPGVSDHVYCAPVARDTPGLVKVWSALIERALASERGIQSSHARAQFARTRWSWARCADLYDRLLHEVLDER